MKIISMHVGLFKYIFEEVKKKKTIKEHLKFFRNVFKSYLKVVKQEFINFGKVFDKDFQKNKKKYAEYQTLKVDLNRALKLLKVVDNKLSRLGKSRQDRRRFWREFFKDGQVRVDLFKELEKDLEGTNG